MEQFLESVEGLGGSALAVLIVCVVYLLAHRLLTRQFPAGSKFVTIRRLVLALLAFFGSIIILMALPISDEMKGQILSFIGIIVSAALALSSTTLFGNALAALMMRIVNHFQVGDFIRTENYFGKVTDRRLFHTEIQTEDRNLQTIPNLFLATKPVKVIRPSGTILTGSVSLGYDVQRKDAEEALLKAAESVGLENPFVFILGLGDFSVEYQVHGLLEDINSILSMKSKLYKAMLDALHEADIEIVSPTFMNQRVVTEKVYIPALSHAVDEDNGAVEKIIFDKADLAERLEKEKLDIKELEVKIGELEAKVDERDGDLNLNQELEVYRQMKDLLLKKRKNADSKDDN
ncbi:MAG: mechanosensitive ion channel [Flavobacteriales bacterium]|nr:mechanosensitive ion channel [Flavobacteriales bacterium]